MALSHSSESSSFLFRRPLYCYCGGANTAKVFVFGKASPCDFGFFSPVYLLILAKVAPLLPSLSGSLLLLLSLASGFRLIAHTF